MGNILGGPQAALSPADLLRREAEQHKQQRNQCFEKSKAAYSAGDHAGAKHYSQQGKEHDRKLKELNSKAADMIYRQRNAGRDEGTVDLHGLKVHEAIAKVEEVIKEAKAQCKKQVVLIVGRVSNDSGHHYAFTPCCLHLH